MVSMFSTAEIDRWTPLAHPFDEAVAIAYVANLREALAADLLPLAVTEDGREPLSEVMLFAADEPLTCQLAYAVGSSNRGRRLAARSGRTLLPAAAAAGYQRARMRTTTAAWATSPLANAPVLARGPARY
jgi:hypothetical protein